MGIATPYGLDWNISYNNQVYLKLLCEIFICHFDYYQNLVWNDSGFVGLALWRTTFAAIHYVYTFVLAHLNVSQYDNTLFLFTLFSRLK